MPDAGPAPASDERLAARSADDLVTRLGRWYARSARDLPWRRTRDPYAIWISEAMLQQTRVETVVPYWERFLERFPTFEALARADEDDVLAAWSGLGYYRRARALRAAARVVVERHGGRFPDELEAALALPGVGPYTAGAVLSIAYDRPAAIVDGNVTRVLARLFELDDPVGSSTLTRAVWDLARELVPARGAGGWNQALMELGATLCRPREPECGRCPLARSCRALASGRAGELPRPRPKPATIAVDVDAFVVVRAGSLLLEKRPSEGRMAGLWQLPTRERVGEGIGARTGPAGDGSGGRERARTLLFPSELPPGLSFEALELGRLRHGITRHRLSIRVLGAAGSRARVERRLPDRFRWHAAAAVADLPRTGITKKALAARFVADWLAER